MITFKRSIAGILALALLAQPVTVLAGNICRDAVEQELDREHRQFRAVMYGLPPAEQSQISEVRYDDKGAVWIKTAKDEWRSAKEKHREDGTMTDDGMDEASDVEPRKGIFERRRVLTSNLIPYITSSLRAVQCRFEQVCMAANQSIEIEEGGEKYQDCIVEAGKTEDEEKRAEKKEECKEDFYNNAPQDIEVEPTGCMKFKRKSIPACHLEGRGQTKLQESDLLTYCTQVSRDLLEREMHLTKLTVEYDAAYRSLLYFAGNFDTFLQSWRWTLLGTFRQVTQLIGLLQRIPCFISSCDETPPLE